MASTNPSSNTTQRRGFASMDEQKQREIARKGGQAVHQKGTAHEFSSEEARIAGHKGGQKVHEKGTSYPPSSEETQKKTKKEEQ